MATPFLERYFLEHPRSVGQSYFEHLNFAWRFGGRLFAGACAAFVHGLLPNIHTSTASRTVSRLHHEMAHRNRRQRPLQTDVAD